MKIVYHSGHYWEVEDDFSTEGMGGTGIVNVRKNPEVWHRARFMRELSGKITLKWTQKVLRKAGVETERVERGTFGLRGETWMTGIAKTEKRAREIALKKLATISAPLCKFCSSPWLTQSGVVWCTVCKKVQHDS